MATYFMPHTNMVKCNTSRHGIGLSLALFLCSLPLSGYYTGPTQQDNYAFALLLTGWMGVFNAHFSWLANPLYFWAVKRHKADPRGSALLAILAFAVALEFLVHRKILIDGNGGTATITGVGWGYLIWLLSFLTLAYSSTIRIDIKNKGADYFLLLLMAFTTIWFGYKYYISNDNHATLVSQRDQQFSALCNQAGEKFYAKPSTPISGIFFSEDGGNGYRNFTLGRYGVKESSIFSSRGLPQIPLVEMPNLSPHASTPYLRDEGDSGKQEAVTDLKSNYFVIISNLSEKLPSKLALEGRAIYVYEKNKKEPLATSIYATSQNDRRFCGQIYNGSFSEIDFIFRALKLRPNFNAPSTESH